MLMNTKFIANKILLKPFTSLKMKQTLAESIEIPRVLTTKTVHYLTLIL